MKKISPSTVAPKAVNKKDFPFLQLMKDIMSFLFPEEVVISMTQHNMEL